MCPESMGSIQWMWVREMLCECWTSNKNIQSLEKWSYVGQYSVLLNWTLRRKVKEITSDKALMSSFNASASQQIHHRGSTVPLAQHHPRLHCMIAWSFHPEYVITGMHFVRSLRQPGPGHQRPSGHLTASHGFLDHQSGLLILSKMWLKMDRGKAPKSDVLKVMRKKECCNQYERKHENIARVLSYLGFISNR